MTTLADFLPNNAIPVHTGAPPAEDPSSSTQVNNAGMEVDSDSDSGYDGNSAAESSSDDDDDATKTSEPRNTTNEADDDDDDEDDTKMEYDEADDECDRTAPSQEPWPTPREAAKVSKKAAKAARQQANKPEQATTATPTPTTEPRSYASAVGGNKRTSRKRDVGFHPHVDVQRTNVKPLLSHLTRVHLVPNTSTLKWDVATREALDGLPGLAFDIPVARGVTARCMLEKAGVLESSFYFDVRAGFRSHAEETVFCDFIYAVEPRLFYATAVTTAESTGTRGAQFSLYFHGMAKPNFLLVGDKCADELLAFRIWHRIYTMDHEPPDSTTQPGGEAHCGHYGQNLTTYVGNKGLLWRASKLHVAQDHQDDLCRRFQPVIGTVDQVLDEAIYANEAAAATIKNQAAQMADALKTKRFDLAELTTLGCIYAAWRNVCLHPIAADAQLKEMARLNRTLYLHFISQRTLNRLFRATYGQCRPFDVLYKLVVGENYSTTSITAYFRKVQAAKDAAVLDDPQ
ncbi:hypothetical protein DYB32_008408 [Aphanomyces invadans]|uniref:Uncharacterized protein n=1 Tax=Aphanomyces invadans TaxID=157072 RepID=A0A418AL65_9STRA|nr:hypothetical protein DYB32_008408 [Aphanomyces invadans]